MRLELGLGLAVGIIVAIARWRHCRWRSSPLGQAQAACERGREVRLRQRAALERWHTAEWAILIVVGIVGLAAAAAPLIAALSGARH